MTPRPAAARPGVSVSAEPGDTRVMTTTRAYEVGTGIGIQVSSDVSAVLRYYMARCAALHGSNDQLAFAFPFQRPPLTTAPR